MPFTMSCKKCYNELKADVETKIAGRWEKRISEEVIKLKEKLNKGKEAEIMKEVKKDLPSKKCTHPQSLPTKRGKITTH